MQMLHMHDQQDSRSSQLSQRRPLSAANYNFTSGCPLTRPTSRGNLNNRSSTSWSVK